MDWGLHQTAVWLSRSAANAWARRFVVDVPWSYPAIQTLHILSVCVIFGAVGALAFRILTGEASRADLAAALRRTMPWTWAALAVQIITGAFMVIHRPPRALDSMTFPWKMLAIAAGLAGLIWIGRDLRRRPEGAAGGGLRIAGALTLALWVGVILAGRWISYVRAG